MRSDPLDSYVLTLYHYEILNEVCNQRDKIKKQMLDKKKSYRLKHEKEASTLFAVIKKLFLNTMRVSCSGPK